MVYGRTIDGKEAQFGTTGYTRNHVFILYDRATGSVWHPLTDKTMDAVSGPKKGEKIEFLAKPKKMTLGQWRKKHPKTTVMLPAPWSKTFRSAK